MVVITFRGNVRFKGEAKFPEKNLVWIAISERSISSKPPFRKSKAVSINGPIYLLKLKYFDANYLQTIMKHPKTNLRKIL